jgi:glycosidase
MRLRLTAAPLLLALGIGGSNLVGCGSDAVKNTDFGLPPDAGTFNPGNGTGGDGYGSSGSTGSSSGNVPPVCPDELKACAQEFTFPDNGESSVELRGDFGGPDTWVQGQAMAKSGGKWRATVNVPFGKQVQYKFFINGSTWTEDPAQPTIKVGNDTNNVFAGTTCEPAICTDQGALPDGVFDWRDSVIYFVFVDRFNNVKPDDPSCNIPGVTGGTKSIANYQGGDWAGVTAKIKDGYFSSMGVNTLWVTVPLENTDVAGKGVGGDTRSYSGFHGYWPKLDSNDPTALTTEKCFGTMDDLKEMVTEAHKKNIKVLYDYAMVHVHSASQIYQSNSSWFWPNNNGKGGNCICGEGCSWDAMPDRERCWFTDYLPHWNYTNSAARAYSTDNAVAWVKQPGIDGFRADAIKHIDLSWLTELRSKLDSQVLATQNPKQRFYMVGETYDFFNRDLLKSYIDTKTKLDGQFDFPLRRVLVETVLMRKGKLGDLASFMDGNDFFYGANAIMSTFIGNHDLPRVVHLAANSRIFGDDQGAGGKERAWENIPGIPQEREAFERMANGFAVLFTNRGAPLVYYGDEVGLPGAGDPDNRRFMQWSGLDANQSFLLERVKKLGTIRAEHPALRRGTRTTLSTTDDTWVYSRVTSGDTVYVAINRGDSERSVSGIPSGSYTELLTGAASNGGNVSVPARQTRIFVKK